MSGNGYSFQTGHRNSFGVADYVIFVATLIGSAGIGVFYAIKVSMQKLWYCLMQAVLEMYVKWRKTVATAYKLE